MDVTPSLPTAAAAVLSPGRGWGSVFPPCLTSGDTGKLGQPCRVWAGEGVVLESKWVVVQRAGEERTEG